MNNVLNQVAAAELTGPAVVGYAVVQLVEALRYKPEGRGFDSRWSHKFFSDLILPVAL